MTDLPASISMIQEIERRQDELLGELDALNQRAENLLKEWVGDKKARKQGDEDEAASEAA